MKAILVSIVRAVKNEMKYFIIPIVVAAAIYIIFNLFFVLSIVPTKSMDPTIPAETIIVSKKDTEDIKRGDIIIFYSEEEKMLLVKRVVGIGGDNIEIINDKYTINDETPDEEYAVGKTAKEGINKYTVPENHYFVLGDNREDSKDSRFFKNPYISKDQIKGKVIYNISVGDEWYIRSVQ